MNKALIIGEIYRILFKNYNLFKKKWATDNKICKISCLTLIKDSLLKGHIFYSYILMILRRLQDSSLTATARASPSWSSSTIQLAAHSNWMYLQAWWLSNKFGVSNNKSSWNQVADAATFHTRILLCSSLETPLGIAAPSRGFLLRMMLEFPWISELTFILAEKVNSTKMPWSSSTISGQIDSKSFFKKSQTRLSETS